MPGTQTRQNVGEPQDWSEHIVGVERKRVPSCKGNPVTPSYSISVHLSKRPVAFQRRKIPLILQPFPFLPLSEPPCFISVNHVTSLPHRSCCYGNTAAICENTKELHVSMETVREQHNIWSHTSSAVAFHCLCLLSLFEKKKKEKYTEVKELNN
jgi:hypothetical protein